MKLDQKEIKKLLKKEDPTILEIGAHKGFDTQLFLKEFKFIKIYCFEPDPRCIKGFQENIKDNRSTLIEAAVSNMEGKTLLHLSGGYFLGKLSRFYKILKALKLTNILFQNQEEWDLSSSIKKSISNSRQYPWLTFTKDIEVNTIKLDNWTKKNNINYIDFIWADVQGAEKDLIEGATETLKTVNYLFTEYGETSSYPDAMTRNETIELLKKHDFEIVEKYSSNSKTGDLLFQNKNLI